MLQLPTDYLVDVFRVDLARLGCTRIIVLGKEEMADAALRTGLARWGMQVFAAPKEAREWIASLLGYGDHSLPQADGERLRALLADGVEHGAEAIVVADEGLARHVRSCDLGMPTLLPNPRGSVVRIKNVVFDMGGVLFRWDPLGMARRVCAKEDDARLLAQTVFGSTEWAWQDAGAVDEQTVLWTSKARLPRHLHSAVKELVLHWHEHRVPVDGMENLIRDLKGDGYGIYLLSNAGESFARYERQLPARECFDGIVVSCHEHTVKPDARIYRTLLDRFSLDGPECLFVDDARVNVLGARRVGMRAYHFGEDADVLRAILLN